MPTISVTRIGPKKVFTLPEKCCICLGPAESSIVAKPGPNDPVVAPICRACEARQKRFTLVWISLTLLPCIGFIVVAGVINKPVLILVGFGWLAAWIITLFGLRTRLAWLRPARVTPAGLRFANAAYQREFDALNPVPAGTKEAEPLDPTVVRFEGRCLISVSHLRTAPNVTQISERFGVWKSSLPRPAAGFSQERVVCPVCDASLTLRIASRSAASNRAWRMRILGALLTLLALAGLAGCAVAWTRPGDNTAEGLFQALFGVAAGVGAIIAFAASGNSVWIAEMSRRADGRKSHVVSTIN